jgi:tetracycline 7-halogenase / FADH2 O2-dependent halogenase
LRERHLTFDLAIVGSGFGGSLLAMIARRLGRSVVLLDRDRHPRFAIGESSTPLANLLLEELATHYDLPRLLPLTKWGTWQSSYPEIPCGLKRGFSFYHHTFDRPFAARPLLVAASPHDAIADTHWYRADFDHFLVEEAQRLGAVFYDQVTLDRITTAWDLEGTRGGRRLAIRARFVVDATGPCGFLHRALRLPEAPFPNLPATEGLYAHFQGVRRLDNILPTDEPPPYPVDDAALHHVFDGGWIWVLRFNNGITSAGAAVTAALARELNLAEGAPAWQRLLARLPTVAEQFAEAEPVTPFVHRRPLAFRSARFTGERWAMLPSAAGFIDPLLSTGFPLTLLGVARLAEALERGDFEEYESETGEALQTAERLIAALYASFADFPLFTALSLLYFAAASFTETARRLGRPHLAGAFLLSDHPTFGPRARACCERALKSRDPALIEEIHRVIEPIDIAGLGDRCRRNWFPVEAEDLLSAADKLGATPEEIEALLRRSGFSPAPPR